MRKCISLVLLLALISLSLGTVMPVAAADMAAVTGPIAARTVLPVIEQAPAAISGNATLDVWQVTFETEGAASANWTHDRSGLDTRGSATLSVSGNQDTARVKLANDPFAFASVSGNMSSQVKTYVLPVSGNISNSLYYYVYGDIDGDGLADYNLSTPLTQESLITSEWASYVPMIQDGQVKWRINKNLRGFTPDNPQPWDAYKAVSGNDTIISLGVALSGAHGASEAALDSLTFGSAFYDISGIQDAIDRAAEGDTVSVHPGKYDEFIDVNKRLTVKSTGGSETTIIQPAALPQVASELFDEFGQIVLISAPGVVFEGFKVIIDGYLNDQYRIPDTGIIANMPELQMEAQSSQNLQILNNKVQISKAMQASGIAAINYPGKTYFTGNMVVVSSNATDVNGSAMVNGIEVSGCEYVTLTGNTVNLDVNSGEVTGIYASLSGTVLAGDNLVTVKTGKVQAEIEGIYFDRVADVLAAGNIIGLTTGNNYSYLEGIGVWDWEEYNAPPDEEHSEFVFNRAMIDFNEITCTLALVEGESPEPTSPWFAEMYGIWIESGYQMEAYDNLIIINADCQDHAYIDGLTVLDIVEEAGIFDNNIKVQGVVTNANVSYLKESAYEGRHTHPGFPQAAEDGIYDIIGNYVYKTGAAGYGIALIHTGSAEIAGNNIDCNIMTIAFTVDLQESATGNQTEVTGGVSASGIIARYNAGPQISENRISVISDLVSGNITENSEPVAAATGISLATGIDLNSVYGGIVNGNSVRAKARGQGVAAAEIAELALPANPLMEEIKSTVLANLDEILTQVTGQAWNVELQGRPRANMAASQGAFGIIGIGIVADNSPGIEISNNDPVTGIADGMVISVSVDGLETNASSAYAEGLVVGLGGGILLTGCNGAQVINNGTGLTDGGDEVPYTSVPERGVAGNSITEAMIEAGEYAINQSIGSAALNTGVSFGILALGTDTGETGASSDIIIRGNHVLANGNALIKMTAKSDNSGETIAAAGANLSLRMGIGTVVGQAVIAGNTVTAADYSRIQNVTRSTGEEMAAGEAAAAGISLGIFTYGGIANQILNNHIESTAESYTRTKVDNDAEVLPEDAGAIAGDLAISAGILSMGGYRHTIRGNYSMAATTGVADVEAASHEPLDEAEAVGLLITFSSGLILMGGIMPQADSLNAHTVTENHFEAAARGGIGTSTSGYFLENTLVALGLNLEALVMAAECNFNYNDVFSGNTSVGQASNFYIAYLDYGLLNLNSIVNARYNYWGDSTGPSGSGSGNGTALGDMSLSGSEVHLHTQYSWWLSHPIADLSKDKVGYYGFGYQLHEGWNTLSAPMALENPLWTTADKKGIADSGLDWEIAYYYDSSLSQPWVQITKDSKYRLKPLEGIYVKMKSDGMVFLASSPGISIPSRNLSEEQSWFLIGPTPYDSYFPFTESMPVNVALKSLEKTPSGLVGYDQVMSPAVGDQAPWVYIAGQEVLNMPHMLAGKAYWVFMENKDTLAGFIATPMPAKLPISDDMVGFLQE